MVVEVEAEENETESATLTLGDTFEFDGSSGLIEITFGTDIEWTVVDNEFSDEHQEDVFAIPVTVKNISDETGGLNDFDFSIFGSNGTLLPTVNYYFEDDITEVGRMRAGTSQEGLLHVLYDGDGEYVVEFDNWSETLEIIFNITK